MVKTLFDPCPSGWRVPLSGEGKRSPWVDFALPGTMDPNSPESEPGTGLFAGNIFHTTTPGVTSWYSASGFRMAMYANFGYCSTYSRYHASSAASSSASYLLFLKGTEIQVSTSAMRAYGYSVRCIRE